MKNTHEQTRKFNIAEADKYLKPDYRKPWLFPTSALYETIPSLRYDAP